MISKPLCAVLCAAAFLGLTPGVPSRGNLVSYQAEADFDGDHTIDVRSSTVSTYNSRGQLLTATTDLDSDGDGTIDQTSVVTTVYDGVKR